MIRSLFGPEARGKCRRRLPQLNHDSSHTSSFSQLIILSLRHLVSFGKILEGDSPFKQYRHASASLARGIGKFLKKPSGPLFLFCISRTAVVLINIRGLERITETFHLKHESHYQHYQPCHYNTL